MTRVVERTVPTLSIYFTTNMGSFQIPQFRLFNRHTEFLIRVRFLLLSSSFITSSTVQIAILLASFSNLGVSILSPYIRNLNAP